MKTIHNTKIIGIDHGYGNMKTANCCFPTGITAYDHEPLFTADMLVYGGRYYLIGEGHKEFAPDKIKDEDYYVLTLAAIAKELNAENLTEAHIVVAAGLPLTWTSGQKADFRAYLMKNAEVEFTYKKADYHLYIDDVRIYPQGYAAIASFATTLKGVNLIADIGNGTMNTLYMINGKPQNVHREIRDLPVYACCPGGVYAENATGNQRCHHRRGADHRHGKYCACRPENHQERRRRVCAGHLPQTS